ncbi:MAG: Putative reactivating factor for D-ornithine aminomutase [Clostridiales bacterium 38_11]|nr:MAG: Putative reactivating factor for D-ornithine aminomutase [Clostridiales bacterium 38_11]HBH12253.1 DNA mismatch repair protein MutL [Clostridiales bacterium]
MRIDVLVAEIGSTTTVINAFNEIDGPDPCFMGQGQAPTSVLEGDVIIGLNQAFDDLKTKLKIPEITYDRFLATSSAAGGLKMTVHGLVYDMTVRAAKEAALGAGANIHMVTAGRLRRTDVNKIKSINPNIILLAGGVDYGERDTAIYNAKIIAGLALDIPVIYAGNIENQDEIREIFEGKKIELWIVENVYPKIDQLNIEPTRSVIQDVFEKHIIHAPGMEHVRDMVNGSIVPTPGAVMIACQLLYDRIGDVVTFDVGGATTDVHSVTEGSEEIERILINPEPKSKRTVEGDLGVYINMKNIVDLIGIEEISKSLKITVEAVDCLILDHPPIPTSNLQIRFVELLTEKAVSLSLQRHAGKFRDLYSTAGRKKVAEGKDLTKIKYIVGTGGALTRLPQRTEIIKKVIANVKGSEMFPTAEAEILIDNDYIMASLGAMSKEYPEVAFKLMAKSMRINTKI